MLSAKLDTKNVLILRNFIQLFLPPTGTDRKNTGNELKYIHGTLDRILKVQFGFNIDPENVLDAFIELGYKIIPMAGEWNPELKTIKPSKSSDGISGGVYSELKASFIYIDVKASDVKGLRRSTTNTPNTGQVKAIISDKLKKKIGEFKAAQ